MKRMREAIVTEVFAGRADVRSTPLFGKVDSFVFADRRNGRMVVEARELGQVTVASVRSTGHEISLDETNRLTFLVPLSGRLAIEAQGRDLGAAKGGAIVARPGYRRTVVGPATPADQFRASVLLGPAPKLGTSRAAAPPGVAFPATEASAPARALQGFLAYYLEEISSPESPLLTSGAARLAEAMLLDLLFALGETIGTAADRQLAPSAQRVRLAEEIMRARHDEPLTIEELAQEVGVSPRALQLAFQVHRGESPRSVLGGVRLDQARERLLLAVPGATVTDVALACGFSHFGRFAAAYRRRFGETPSETLHRARRFA